MGVKDWVNQHKKAVIRTAQAAVGGIVGEAILTGQGAVAAATQAKAISDASTAQANAAATALSNANNQFSDAAAALTNQAAQSGQVSQSAVDAVHTASQHVEAAQQLVHQASNLPHPSAVGDFICSIAAQVGEQVREMGTIIATHPKASVAVAAALAPFVVPPVVRIVGGTVGKIKSAIGHDHTMQPPQQTQSR